MEEHGLDGAGVVVVVRPRLNRVGLQVADDRDRLVGVVGEQRLEVGDAVRIPLRQLGPDRDASCRLVLSFDQPQLG